MTMFRLQNDIFQFHEPVIEYKLFRRQFHGVKVWFAQENETLLDKLKNEWQPIDVAFTSDSKHNAIPDISIWNTSCLILSQKAKTALAAHLSDIGEFLVLNDGFCIFNCLSSIDGNTIDQTKSSFSIEHEESLHIPKELTLLPEKIGNKFLFKPEFSHNGFLICQDDFKNIIKENQLGGILFEENLSQIFPRKE